MSTAPEKELVRIVTQHAALVPDPDLRVVYMRRKHARGIVALLARGRHPERMACVSIDENELSMSGVGARATLDWFPQDPALRKLANCCEPKANDRLWEALARAECSVASTDSQLLAADAKPLRYTPRDRCVLRYRLMLDATRGGLTELSVIGKAYREPDDAHHAHTIAQQLHRREARVVARPLGLVDELGVVLAQDVSGLFNVPGTAAVRLIRDTEWPDREIHSAAAALAVFHSSSAIGGRSYPATRAAAKALERSDLLAGSVPSLAAKLSHVSALIAKRLLRPTAVTPAWFTAASSQANSSSARTDGWS